jgi:5'-3' exonuclease
MGIKNFSKIFDAKDIKLTGIKKLNIVVDASVIIYQASLGIKNINALTDGEGNSTIHINVVIAKCLNFYKYGARQAWVFDYHEKGYVNPAKIYEIEKRKKIKDRAEKKLQELKEKDDLFSSDEDVDEKLDDKINMQEKICFSMNDRLVNDVKFILNCFDIPWCDTPKGYEAESVCAALTNESEYDTVWTTDTDAVIYGAKQVIRELKIKQKKSFMLYNLDDIMSDKNIDMDDLRKIAVISGSDHAPKTPRVGPKTIFKKFKEIVLTSEQKDAVKVFTKIPDVSKLSWSDKHGTEFENSDGILKLLDWLSTKNFNIERIQKQINKALN